MTRRVIGPSLSVALLLAVAGCGDDGGDGGGTDDPQVGSSVSADDLCEVLSTSEVATASGLAIDDARDARFGRFHEGEEVDTSGCAFSDGASDVQVMLLESGGDAPPASAFFAAALEEADGFGEEVDGLGDGAFHDRDELVVLVGDRVLFVSNGGNNEVDLELPQLRAVAELSIPALG
jgi:hypothetical protein